MGAPIHGYNGLIYVSGTEITGANEWSIDVAGSAVETPQFSDTWVKRVAGPNDWSGSISAWEQTDASVLFDAAAAVAEVALLIYPSRGTLANYYSGNAVFSFGSSGSTSSAVGNTASFVGDDTLTQAGFA